MGSLKDSSTHAQDALDISGRFESLASLESWRAQQIEEGPVSSLTISSGTSLSCSQLLQKSPWKPSV